MTTGSRPQLGELRMVSQRQALHHGPQMVATAQYHDEGQDVGPTA